MITCIYLDLDGVLVDFVGGLRPLVDRELDLSQYDLGLDREYLDGILREECTRTWWGNLPWTPLGRRIYQVCTQSGIPTMIMSTPANAASAAGKIEWMARELGPSQRYALTTSKHHLAHLGGVLIDDSEKGIDLYREHGGKAMLWPATWNSIGRSPNNDDLRELAETLAAGGVR